jgi:hypothetical protein
MQRFKYDATGELMLWKTVVYQAFRDAGGPDIKYMGKMVPSKDKSEATAWIRAGRANYRLACYLAGLDADFLRESFLSGRMDLDALRRGKE